MKKLVESSIKRAARKMLNEGEVENAESVLAAKDLVDRLQDTIEELGKMSNDELPHLVDAIRNSFGQEQATAYQSTANTVLTSLLDIVKTKKSELENATLVLSGDASADTSSDLNLPDDGEEVPEMDHDDLLAEPKSKNPMGREPRIPTEESLTSLFNRKKKLSESYEMSWDEILENYNDDIVEFNESGDMSRELVRVLAGFYRDEIPMGMEGNEFEWIYDKFVDDLSDEGVIGESKQVLNAKIVAINEALKKTDKKKKPIVAKRLAEELRRLVTEAVKKEAKEKLDSKKKLTKKKVVKESNCAKCDKPLSDKNTGKNALCDRCEDKEHEHKEQRELARNKKEEWMNESGSVAASVRKSKESNPEKFCKNKTCLYRTDAEYCPKHKPVEKK